MPPDTTLVGFADDVAVIVSGNKESTLKFRADRAMTKIDDWLTNIGLQLAPEKTEAMMLTGCRRIKPIQFHLK